MRHVGGRTLDGFDAPLWKLPLFVRGGAIVPRYAAHNSPRPMSARNPGGLDRARMTVDFWPVGRESRYTLYEDDGRAMGLCGGRPDYGGHVAQTFACGEKNR